MCLNEIEFEGLLSDFMNENNEKKNEKKNENINKISNDKCEWIEHIPTKCQFKMIYDTKNDKIKFYCQFNKNQTLFKNIKFIAHIKIYSNYSHQTQTQTSMPNISYHGITYGTSNGNPDWFCSVLLPKLDGIEFSPLFFFFCFFFFFFVFLFFF